jgi:hypothetical protein
MKKSQKNSTTASTRERAFNNYVKNTMSSKKSKVLYEKVEKEDHHHSPFVSGGLEIEESDDELEDELEVEESDDEEQMYGSMPEVIHGSLIDGGSGTNRRGGGTMFRTFCARCGTPKMACCLIFSILCIIGIPVSTHNRGHGSDMSMDSPPSSPGGDGNTGNDDYKKPSDYVDPPLPSQRDKDVTHRLSLVSGPSVSTAGTPQHKATHWILKEDALALRADNPYILQRYLLALLYYKMEGAESINSGMNKNMAHLEFWMDGLMNECEWERIGCDGNGYIVSLTLDNCELTGPLPTEIFVLPRLMHLDLSNNHLTGLLPSELQNLENLTELYLEGNEMYGPVPPDICHRKAEGTLKEVTTDCYEYGDVKVWCNCCKNCAPTDMFDFMEAEVGDDSPYGNAIKDTTLEEDPEFDFRKEKINGKCVQLSGGAASIMNTPQHEAMLWMIFEDKLYLDPESDKFVQRYVALVLHFTFDKQSYFSTSKDECKLNWVECDDEGHIVTLTFGEYFIFGMNAKTLLDSNKKI